MVFFTTPELLEIGGLPFVSPNDKPTRMEALRYYRRVADTFELDIAFDETVTASARDADGGSSSTSEHARRAAGDGRGRTRRAGDRRLRLRRTVMGVPGEDLPHVSHYYTEPHPFYRKRVVIVGGKNSAAEAALELFRAGAHVTIVHRRARSASRSSTGSSPTSRTASRKARSPRASTRASSRSRRRTWSSSSDGVPRRDCRPTACSC